MWHSSIPILNMQLLSGIIMCIRTYLFSILHVGSVPKNVMMPIASDTLHILNIAPLSEKRKLLKNEPIRLFMGLLTFQMHPLCLSPAQITSPDMHILSPLYNFSLVQTLFISHICRCNLE